MDLLQYSKLFKICFLNYGLIYKEDKLQTVYLEYQNKDIFNKQCYLKDKQIFSLKESKEEGDLIMFRRKCAACNLFQGSWVKVHGAMRKMN